MSTWKQQAIEHYLNQSEFAENLERSNGKRRERLVTIEEVAAHLADLKPGQIDIIYGGTVAKSYGYSAYQTTVLVWRDGPTLHAVPTLTGATVGSTGFGHVVRWEPRSNTFRWLDAPLVTEGNLGRAELTSSKVANIRQIARKARQLRYAALPVPATWPKPRNREEWLVLADWCEEHDDQTASAAIRETVA